MSPKQNCIYVIPRIPFPPVGGDRLKYYNSIKILSVKFNLHVIIVSDKPLLKDAEDFLKNHTANYKVFTYGKIRFMANIFKGIFSKKPLQVCYYYFDEVNNYCKQTIKPGDIVIANLIRTALYTINLPNKKILNLEDSIFLNYKASIKKVSSIFWKLVYKIEITRLGFFEEHCIKYFDASTFVNETEQLYYKEKGNTIWLPNGVSNALLTREIKIDNTTPYEVAFLGKMDYQPNVDAVVWFTLNVIAIYPLIKLTIVGAQPSARVLSLKQKYPNNITITGYVDDPFTIMKNKVAVIAPMQTGAGLQNKILEAMAIGCLVIGSSLGTNPIKGAENGKHLLVCNTAEEYKNAIYHATANNNYSNEIGQNARNFIRENYTWEIYSKKFFSALKELGVF